MGTSLTRTVVVVSASHVYPAVHRRSTRLSSYDVCPSTLSRCRHGKRYEAWNAHSLDEVVTSNGPSVDNTAVPSTDTLAASRMAICDRTRLYAYGSQRGTVLPIITRHILNLPRCCAVAMDDGKVFRLTAQHTQQRVEVSKEGIQRCEPAADTLDFPVEAFHPVVN